MRRIVIPAILLPLMIICLIIVPQAMAVTSTNPHGVYSSSTDQCANCHNTHTAKSAKLLKANNEQLSCEICHDGTQSNYNTKTGQYFNGTTWQDSLAGGFDDSFTSKHKVEASTEAPGGTETGMTLVCSTCHNPHGYPSTNNYRMLQKNVNGRTGINVNGVLTAIPSIGVNNNLPPGITAPSDYSPRKGDAPFTSEIASYGSGVDEFCSACHGDYVNYGSNNTVSNQITGAVSGQWNYRHRVGVYMTGGSTSQVAPGDGNWRKVEYGTPLYTTLPTLGAPTGAYIRSLSVSSGSLNPAGAGQSYYYVVTAFNYGGQNGSVVESVYGKVAATPVNAGGAVTINWDPITNAVGYKIYRGVGATQPPISSFKLVDTIYDLGNNDYSYKDEKNSLTSTSPSTVANSGSAAKIMCLTCHFAHGTKVTVAQVITITSSTLSTSGSRLLRLDNRGVCENCHKKGIW